MYCTNCGQQIPDDSIFCTSCGTRVAAAGAAPHMQAANPAPAEEPVAAPAEEPVAAPVEDKAPAEAPIEEPAASETPAQEPAPAPQPTPGPAPQPTPQAAPKAPQAAAPAAKKAAINPKVIGILAAIAVVVIGVVAFLATRKTTIDLGDYVTLEYSGYNEYGTATYTYDTAALDKAGSKLEIKSKSLQKAMEDTYGEEDADDLVSWYGGYDDLATYLNKGGLSDVVQTMWGVSAEITPNGELSNDDEVTLSFDMDEDELALWETIYNCKIELSDVTGTVEGLEEIATFDPFDGVEITYEGTAPNGYVKEVSKGSDAACSGLRYSAEPDDGLSNGDTITVTVSYNGYSDSDWQSGFASEYGKVPAVLTKEFTVEGLPAYITSAADIPEDALQSMQEQAQDAFNAQVAEYWDSETEKLVNFEYIGNYFLTAKDANAYTKNVVYLIYKVADHLEFTNSNGDNYTNTISFYWYCRYENLMVTEDGDCTVDVLDYETPRYNGTRFNVESGVSSGWGTKDWNIYGYEKLSVMYNQLVTTELAKYKAEDNVEDITLTGDGTDVQSEDDPIEETADAEGAGDGEADGDDDGDDDGQVLSYSSDRALTEDDLKGLTKAEIQTAINEIYARHGYTFKDETILAKFKQYDWYKPTVASGSFSESVFSQTEKDNIALMRSHL